MRSTRGRRASTAAASQPRRQSHVGTGGAARCAARRGADGCRGLSQGCGARHRACRRAPGRRRPVRRPAAGGAGGALGQPVGAVAEPAGRDRRRGCTGSSQASRLNPRRCGAASATWPPYFLMKYCDRPARGSCPGRAAAGSRSDPGSAWPQPSDAHSSRLCRQVPHWQTMLRTSQFSSAPTGSGASRSASPAICACGRAAAPAAGPRRRRRAPASSAMPAAPADRARRRRGTVAPAVSRSSTPSGKQRDAGRRSPAA